MTAQPRPRLAVFCDFAYRVDRGRVTAELPFGLFLQALTPHFAEVVLAGRLDPSAPSFPYELTGPEFEPLPYYASGADLPAVMGSLPAAAGRFWRLLERVDVVWVLGPNPPQAIAFALLALLRRRRLVLGVRQRLPQLARHRHARRPALWLSAWALELCFRLLGRVSAVVVVGPELERAYARSRSLHRTVVSLVEEADVVSPTATDRDYDAATIRILSVGRLDPEKNPLLLLEILRLGLGRDRRWQLEVCGDGPLAGELAARARTLGLAHNLVLHGHVPFGSELWSLYRHCHALVHVSMTEGVPQVLLEAFAARLPVVATDVGGVGELVRGRGLLIPARDGAAGAAALRRVLADRDLRERGVQAGSAYVAGHTRALEAERLARFLGATQ